MVHNDLDVSAFEFIEVFVNFNRRVSRVVVVYRPGHPGTDRVFMDEFKVFLDTFSGKNGKLLICGDFNYWVDNPHMKPHSLEFLELIDLGNFTNHVSGPTHILGHTLDLVLSPANSDYVVDVEVSPIDSHISDHALVTFTLNYPRPPTYYKTIIFRNYRNIDQTILTQEIEHSLNEIDTSHSAEELVMIYNNFFCSVSERYCPEVVKKIAIRDDAPWYDSSVASLRRERRRAEKRWRRLRTEESRLEFVVARRAVVSHISKCKVEYYNNCVTSCKGNQKQLYAILNSVMGKETISALPTSDSDADLATAFASFFSSKISRIRDELDSEPVGEFSVEFRSHLNINQTLSHFQLVGADDVLQYIKQSNKTYCKLDPINFSKIFPAYESAAQFIADIINHCFEDESFVSTEKQALLCPLLKKPTLDSENMSSFRPVSNLTFLSKLIEYAILNQLFPLLEANEVIPSLQSAYRACHSTETALCKIYNDLVLNSCSGNISLLVLLDLSAAFDTVDHEMLLGDLWACGVRDSALSLIKSYLSDRFQSVIIGKAVSEPVSLKYGVPQGSVLGPVLFTVYTSSLATLLERHGVAYHFYADDTQLYIQVENVVDTKNKIESLVSDIKIWMTKRKLKLNESKTEIIIIQGNLRGGMANDFGLLHVGDTQFVPAESVRDLGIIFDTSLRFDIHINSLVRNCNYHIRNLYAVKKYLDRQSLLALVHSLVLSRLDYCNCLLVGLPKCSLKKLQSILNRVARLIFSVPPRTPTTPLLIELHWLPIKARIEFKICLMTYKVLKFGKPTYLAELLSPLIGGTDMNLRSSDDPFRLDEPRAVQERSFANRSFSFTAPRLYNGLPLSIKQLDSIIEFKRQLK